MTRQLKRQLGLWLSGTLLVGAALLAGAVRGQSETPSTLRLPISDVLQAHQGLSISGTVTSVVGNTFVLDDGTGSIIVDAGPRWYRPVEVRVGERLTVIGKPGRGEFDAYRLVRQDGETIEIRPAEGPPPWAGPPWLRNHGPAGLLGRPWGW